MSFKAPSQIVNPTAITLHSVEDFFNPTKHMCYVVTPSRHKFKDWIDILKILFCRENLNNPDFVAKMIFNTDSDLPSETATFYSELVRMVPDEKLWMLNWVQIRAYSRALYDVNTITAMDYSQPNHVSFTYDLNRIRVETPLQAFSHVENFLTSFGTFYTLHENKYIQDIFFGWSEALSRFYSMVRGERYAASTTSADGQRGSSVSADQLRNLITSNPTGVFKVTFGNGNITIRFSIPITYANRSALYNVFAYSTDVTNMLQGPRKAKGEGTPVYVGVELEVSTDYSINELIDAVEEPFFIAKSDGSITGSKRNPMELVTVPGSFKYLKRQYALWFNNLDYNRFDCTNQTNNGMHVHVDRKAFDDDYHIRNFCWFINNPANTPFIVAMSDRGSLQAMSQYTPFLNFSSNLTRTTAFKSCHRLLDGHRGATNLKNGWARAKTVEVRLFRGIVSYTAIVKNLEFVESVFLFTQSLRSYREQSLANYIEWLFKTPVNRFSVLKKFIETQDIKKFLVVADIKDIIFNETDPDKIAQLLMKSGLKITNNHISVINKGRKRTFTLDPSTGQISVIRKNVFKLSSMDTELAKRFSNPTSSAA